MFHVFVNNNNNIDPGVNCLNAFNTNASYFAIVLFTNKLYKRNGLSIMHISRRSLCANVTQLKVLVKNL